MALESVRVGIERLKTVAVLIGLGAVVVGAAHADGKEVPIVSDVYGDVFDRKKSTGDYLVMPDQAMNEVTQKMKADIASYDQVDPDWAVRQARNRGGPTRFGDKISVADAMRHFYIAGFRGDQLKQITALAGVESGYYPAAVGDVDWNYEGDISAGLVQVYCQENGPIGCNGIRDYHKNFDPQSNANHAFILAYNSQNDGFYVFRPWQNSLDTMSEFMSESETAYTKLTGVYGDLV